MYNAQCTMREVHGNGEEEGTIDILVVTFPNYSIFPKPKRSSAIST